MLNIIVLTAVAVFIVGIIVGVNLNSWSTEQVFSDAASASLDVPQLDESDLRRMANTEQLGARISLVIWLNSQIAEAEATHPLPISKLASLRTIKAELETGVGGAVSVR